MVTTWCPSIASGADTLVGLAHDKFMQLGVNTYNLAVSNLDGLNAIELAPYEFSVDFNYADPNGAFNRPVKPVFDPSALEYRDPGVALTAPPTYTQTPVLIDAPPELTDVAPTLTFGPRPDAPNIPMPYAPVDAVDVTVPLPPNYVLPPVPTMEQLNLPDVPVVLLPTMDLQRPVWVDPPFQQDWHFDPAPYTRVLVDDIVNTLRPMIVGSDALPAYIEQAIWEKGRSRVELETNRAVSEAFADFAARGFSEPQGQLSGRVLELRQAGQNALSEVTRDVMIKRFELAYEQQRFAITTGAALEGTLIQLHVEEQRFLLEGAKFQLESQMSILNYRVTVFNAQMQAYSTDAQVFRDRIQAEMSKVELYRAQLEGARAIGELNRQHVELYAAQLNGIATMANFYKTQVETARVQADINMQGIEKYKAQLQAYGQRWDAYVAEWRGYSAGVEGESKRVDIYKAMVDANARRVDAWSTGANVKLEMAKLEQQVFSVQTDAWRSKVDHLRTAISAEEARLAAVAISIKAQTDVYAAEAQVETAASSAADRTFELGMRREQAEVDTELKNAEMAIEQAKYLLAQAVEIQKAKAQISSQLAASTMSAVNYGASISSSVGNNRSCSTSFNFSGETMDA